MKKTSKTQALLTGANIRRERMRQDVSQEMLAKRIGKSTQYISLLENGDRCGSIATYLKIATELSLSLGELFTDMKEDAVSLEDERGILKLFYGCSHFERHVMVAVLTAAKMAMRSKR
jgi:transcriptional regulator with XRE-family HTH domain